MYGNEAVITVEVRESSRKIKSPLDEDLNEEALRKEFDLVEEIRAEEALCKATLK